MTLHRHEMPMMMLFDDDRLFGLRRRDTRNDHADRRQRSNRKNEFLHHCLLEDANGPTTTRTGETRSLPMRPGTLECRFCCCVMLHCRARPGATTPAARLHRYAGGLAELLPRLANFRSRGDMEIGLWIPP